MGLEFLTRVRRSTILAGAAAALVFTTYAGLRPGLAWGLGIAWSLVNLSLLQALVVALTGRERGSRPAVKCAVTAAVAMLALFGAGGMLLVTLPPLWTLAGFLVPLLVLVLKAASMLLLRSRVWRWLVASPWRASVALLAVVVAAWWAVPALFGRPASASAPRAAAGARALDHALAAGSNPAQTSGSANSGGNPAPSSGPANAGANPAQTAGSARASEPSAPAASKVPETETSQGPEKFPNAITVVSRANPHAEWAHVLHQYEAVIFAWFVGLLLSVFAFLATRKPQMIPGPLQNLVEGLVEYLHGFIAGIIGKRHANRFVPFLGTLGIYIWAMNLIGLIPFMDSPTSSLNITFALAIVVFLYAQYVGIRSLGPVGYIDHFMGQPRTLIGWGLVPLMLPIHVMGELAKPISLSCRLFGNIFGEDMLLVAFATLGISVLAWSHLPFGLPLQVPFLLLALLTSTLQALVFMVLSTIYILLMLPHDEREHEGEAQHAH